LLPAGFTGPLLVHSGTKDDADGRRPPGVREALADVEVVYGAVVAVVERVTCHRCVSCCTDRWGESGAWHWAMEGITALRAPVPATGRLGLWRAGRSPKLSAWLWRLLIGLDGTFPYRVAGQEPPGATPNGPRTR
jgi:hypothetical protein